MENDIFSLVNSIFSLKTLDNFSDNFCDIHFDTSDEMLILKPE